MLFGPTDYLELCFNFIYNSHPQVQKKITPNAPKIAETLVSEVL